MHLRRQKSNTGSRGALPGRDAEVESLSDLIALEARISELRKNLSGLQGRARKLKQGEARQQVRRDCQRAADELSQLEQQYAAAVDRSSKEAADLEKRIWEMAERQRKLDQLMRALARLTKDIDEGAIRIMEVGPRAGPRKGPREGPADEVIEQDEREMLEKWRSLKTCISERLKRQAYGRMNAHDPK